MKKVVGKPFVKGDPRCGRPKDSQELHAVKQMSQGDLKVLLYRILYLTEEELRVFKGNVLEMSLASIVHKAILTGDPTRVEFFLHRLFGKVPDKIEYTDTDKLKELPDIELAKNVAQGLEEFKLKILKGGSNE